MIYDHGPLRYPRRENYASLREQIEYTHKWRIKENRGRLRLFSHTSCYFMDLDAQENVRFGVGWRGIHEEPPGSNHWVRNKERTETILWTLNANNTYTLVQPPENFRHCYSYVSATYRASPFAIANCTIHGVHQVKLWMRGNHHRTYRYAQGLRVTRTGDVLGGVEFKAPIMNKDKAKAYRFLGQWFKDAKAMAMFDTRNRGEHADAVKEIVAGHWQLNDIAQRIVANPDDSFDLFYLTIMAHRYLPWRFVRSGSMLLADSTTPIHVQLVSPYRQLRERILQQAGVYTLPYEV